MSHVIKEGDDSRALEIPKGSSRGRKLGTGPLLEASWAGRGRSWGLGSCINPDEASLVAQMVKNVPAMQETQVQSLSWEDPLEKERAIHSSTLAWKIPWMEEPGGLQSMGSQRVGHD